VDPEAPEDRCHQEQLNDEGQQVDRAVEVSVDLAHGDAQLIEIPGRHQPCGLGIHGLGQHKFTLGVDQAGQQHRDRDQQQVATLEHQFEAAAGSEGQVVMCQGPARCAPGRVDDLIHGRVHQQHDGGHPHQLEQSQAFEQPPGGAGTQQGAQRSTGRDQWKQPLPLGALVKIGGE
jgi:hypothetical protein